MTTKCHEGKPDCFALYDNDRCRALGDTDFHGKACPFYKSRRQMMEENPAYYSTYGEKKNSGGQYVKTGRRRRFRSNGGG